MIAGQEVDKRRPSVRCVWHATYRPNLAHLDRRQGPNIRRAIQDDEDPSRAAYLFPAGCECTTRSGAGRKWRRAQAPPAGPARQERRPILLA